MKTTTLGQRERLDDSSVAINCNARVEPAGSPIYNQLYLPVCDTLIGQLEFSFDKDSLIMAKAVDSVLRCDKEGITAIDSGQICERPQHQTANSFVGDGAVRQHEHRNGY